MSMNVSRMLHVDISAVIILLWVDCVPYARGGGLSLPLQICNEARSALMF